jgi:hypothetical protein
MMIDLLGQTNNVPTDIITFSDLAGQRLLPKKQMVFNTNRSQDETYDFILVGSSILWTTARHPPLLEGALSLAKQEAGVSSHCFSIR